MGDFLGQVLINVNANFEDFSTTQDSQTSGAPGSYYSKVYKKSASSIYGEKITEFEKNAAVDL